MTLESFQIGAYSRVPRLMPTPSTSLRTFYLNFYIACITSIRERYPYRNLRLKRPHIYKSIIYVNSFTDTICLSIPPPFLQLIELLYIHGISFSRK